MDLLAFKKKKILLLKTILNNILIQSLIKKLMLTNFQKQKNSINLK